MPGTKTVIFGVWGKVTKFSSGGGKPGKPGKKDDDDGGKTRPALLFWLLWIILLLAGAVFYLLAGVSMTGWVILVAVFFILWALRNLLRPMSFLLFGAVWFLALLFLFFGLGFSGSGKTTRVSSSGKSSFTQVQLNKLSALDKSFSLPGGKGTGKVTTKVSDGRVTVRIYAKAKNSILPPSFKFTGSGRETIDKNGMGLTDNMIMAVYESGNKSNFDVSSMGPEHAGNNKLAEYSDSWIEYQGWSITELKKFDRLQIAWYNMAEVGYDMEQEKGPQGQNFSTMTPRQDKGFGKHPPLIECAIPWDVILQGI